MLDILVQDWRNAIAAKRFFRRLLASLKFKPKRIVTDGLRSYGVATRKVLPEVRYRTSRYLNNRAENSHRPTRRRERQMQRFKSSEQAQRLLSAHSMIAGYFRPRRHLMIAAQYRRSRAKASAAIALTAPFTGLTAGIVAAFVLLTFPAMPPALSPVPGLCRSAGPGSSTKSPSQNAFRTTVGWLRRT